MQQPKMIVLALLGTGLRYGFEMEEFARRTNMRQWAKIGMSTIYKVLSDLERDGAIVVETEESDKGPARKAYSLTEDGGANMVTLIGEALASDASIYSERIAGLVFVPLMGKARAERAISASMEVLDHADAMLATSLDSPGIDRIGLAVVQYYRTVYEAERQAMRQVLESVK
jgi:DNA-binding PadR family transcriptional regulator